MTAPSSPASPSGRGTAGPRELSRIGYNQARLLLALAGLGVLIVLVAVLLARSVDIVEVWGTLLFVPIFLALLFFGLAGGIVGAVAATLVYVILRADAAAAVGWGEFSGVIGSRAFAYLLFGVVGGWASSTLESSLDKLDLYDQVDDITGLNNARFLLHDIDLERARAERYQSVFSVSFLEVPADALSAMSGRRRRTLLREFGRTLEDGVRAIDRVAHGFDGTTHHIATILPETADEGAATFHGRLVESVRQFLVSYGAAGDLRVGGAVHTVPGDDEALLARLDTWRRIDEAEHANPSVAERPRVR